jgi:WD40 repeat protein
MPEKQKPVIFLAFANDKEDNARYLRNLPKELDGLRKVLTSAVQAGLCEVVERASATIEQILDIFQDIRYKDRIAIFHYGGHADGYQLLLEQLDGSHSVAHGAGLVSFFARQKGLKLVFFNGCSTQQQTLELVEAGVPAVIGTSSAIGDDIATNLSIRFYNGISNGLSIDKAWLESIDYIKIQQGFDKGKGEVNTRGLYRKNTKQQDAPPPDRLPWDMYYKQGAEIVKDWNLPEAVDNPLFGLPDVSQMFDLPDKPYRFLERYREEHTQIFFGRSYYIRDLYIRAIDRNSAPIILLYGQSGVGKSSLLDAGVLPRLEQVSKVVYIRRNQDKGLLGTLTEALGITTDKGQPSPPSVENLPAKNSNSEEKSQQSTVIQQLEELLNNIKGEAKNHLSATIEELRIQENKKAQFDISIDESEKDSLKGIWKIKEKDAQQPFIVILDQAEEAFTRPNDNLPNELDDFLVQVHSIFGNPKDRPVGKLILSYRKEYSAEFDEAFKKMQIPREGIFLKHLERRDIIEVITGLTLSPHLRNCYRLNIEAELPVIIADDLLEDKDSPIAPILQILLTKMWNMTEQEELRYFSVKKYQELKKEGILMNDFFHQQMELFKKWNENEENSGLALDILNFHTTALGTAGSRRISDLKERYAHRAEVIEPILKKFQELYLLAGFSRTVTGLAHDTLAPVVQNEFRSSDRDSQKATRVLENRLNEFEDNPTLVLDETDLGIVEKGQVAMRIWTDKEKELVEASRLRREQNLKREKRNKMILRGLGALIALMLVVGFIFQQRFTREIQEEGEKTKVALKQSQIATQKAEVAKQEADKQKKEAEKQKEVAEQQSKIAKQESEKAQKNAEEARRQSQIARNQSEIALQQKEKADDSKLKAIMEGERAKTEEKKAKRATLTARQNLYWFNAKELAIKAKAIQSDESRELKSLLALTSYKLVDSAFSSPKNKKYPLEVIDALQDALLKYDQEFKDEENMPIKGEVKAFGLDFANKQIAMGIKDSLIIAEITDYKPNQYPIFEKKHKIHIGKNQYIRALSYSTDGKLLALSTTNGNVYTLALEGFSKRNTQKLTTAKLDLIYKHSENVLEVKILDYQSSLWLVSTSRDNTIKVWDLKNNREIATLRPNALARCFRIVDNQLFAGLRNGSLVVWDLDNLGKLPPTTLFQDTKYTFFDLKYLPTKKWLVAGTDKGEVLIFNTNDASGKWQPSILKESKHAGIIYSLALSRDEKWLATAGLDRVVKMWDLSEIRTIQDAQLIAPWEMSNPTPIFSLQFTADSKYLIYGDNQKLNIRSVDIHLLFDKLKENIKFLGINKLPKDKELFYIKGNLNVPSIF